MAARKKKTKRISFKSGISKRKKNGQTSWLGPSMISILKVLVIACVTGGTIIGLVFLERYVKKTSPGPEGTITLELEVPTWVNDRLKEKVLTAAKEHGNNLTPDENAALTVQQSIEKEVVWLDGIKVQATHEGFRIKGQWRRPIALVRSGVRKYYIDIEQVVLDFVEMPHLPIVEITGLSSVRKIPRPGDAWIRDDLSAAIDILNRLEQMDRLVTPDKPLLYEIDRIDVSNFNGRQSARAPHIVLYSKDNTQIVWGAETGRWQRYLESTDEEKLAKLYGYYKEYGTLSGGVKYINLRDPQDNIPLPIDKY